MFDEGLLYLSKGILGCSWNFLIYFECIDLFICSYSLFYFCVLIYRISFFLLNCYIIMVLVL